MLYFSCSLFAIFIVIYSIITNVLQVKLAVESMVTRVMQGGNASLAGDTAFPPGSTVEFRTVLGGLITGQVVCFDAHLKVLVIKETKEKGNPILRVFNLKLISDIKEIASPDVEPSDFLAGCSISNNTVTDRAGHAEEKKRTEMMEENIPLAGQQAFITLRHVLNHVCWNGPNIEVLNSVTVPPPYTAESIRLSNSECEDEKGRIALTRVKKILGKPFVGERRLTPCCQHVVETDPADPK